MTPRVPIDPNAKPTEPPGRRRSLWRAFVLDYVVGTVRTLQHDFSQWSAVHPPPSDPHE
jgi:hypothetical protein